MAARHRCFLSTRTFAVGLGGLVVALSPVTPSHVTAQTVEPLLIRASAIEDSTEYFVYLYTALNPRASQGGVAAFMMDLTTDSSGVSSALPATGPFYDGPARNSPVPVSPHAAIGPISPANWQAALGRDGILSWYGINGGLHDHDSIAPADSLNGLGLRSSFLPGLRNVKATPTWQACCSEPWGTEQENPDREHRESAYYGSTSTTVGPRFSPSDMGMDVLRSQLAAVCERPEWISDPSLCVQLEDLLSPADGSTPADLRTFVDTIAGAAREATVSPNAFLLLTTNATWLLRQPN